MGRTGAGDGPGRTTAADAHTAGAQVRRRPDGPQRALTMGLTFDTGALIGLERARHRMRKVYDTAVSCDVPITVPAVVVAEWWRAGAREKERAQLLRSVRVEPITDLVARLAGVALTLVPGVQTIDALVMASASQRGHEVVYTSDPDDLLALRDGVPYFAALRIERA